MRAARARIKKQEAQDIALSWRKFSVVDLRHRRGPVPGKYIPYGRTYQGRNGIQRIEYPLQTRGDAVTFVETGVRGPSEREQKEVFALDLGQRESARNPIQYVRGGGTASTLLKPGIPGWANIRALRYFLTSQTWRTPTRTRKAKRRRVELAASVFEIGPEPPGINGTALAHPVSLITSIRSLLYYNIRIFEICYRAGLEAILVRIFVTGATGNIGSYVVADLIAAGHEVVGLCRSEKKAPRLAAAGAEVLPGSLEDLNGLRAAAVRCDGVIHLAFNHDFSRYLQNCEDDRRVIATLGSALAGSSRPLIVTSGTAVASASAGQPAQEDDAAVSSSISPRAASEEAASLIAAEGINVSVVRLPQVHDRVTQGFITPLIAACCNAGACAYIGTGSNRWPAVHMRDAARLYRLAIERAEPSAIYHAVAEEGIRMRDILSAIQLRLKLPVRSVTAEEAQSHFGWLAPFVALDMPATSLITQTKLGWHPQEQGLLSDLEYLELPAPPPPS